MFVKIFNSRKSVDRSETKTGLIIVRIQHISVIENKDFEI